MIFLAVNFHYISDRRFSYPGIYPVRPVDLVRQLDELGLAFNFIGLPDLVDALHEERGLPERSCLITFDDGLREQCELAWPILQRKGIPAAFFVNTGPVLDARVSTVHKIHALRACTPPEAFLSAIRDTCRELMVECATSTCDEQTLAMQYRYDAPPARELKYLLNFQLSRSDRDTVVDRLFAQQFGCQAAYSRRLYMQPEHWRQLAAQQSLGTHGRDHVPLAALSVDEVRYNVQESVRDLISHTGAQPTAISYPYGGPTAVSRTVAEVAQEVGLRIGFTMERAVNRSLSDPLLFARADTNDSPGGKRPQIRFIHDGIAYNPPFGSCRHRWVSDQVID